MKMNLNTIILSIFAVAFLFWGTAVRADLAQIKAYKEAYPDTKPKCIDCHVDEHPKKDDGKHDSNDYGKAVVKAAGKEKPTADTYKTVGTIENFSKK